MDFPAEASTSNRHHRLDRIRSKKSCRRSLQFSNGECLYQLFLHTSFNSGGNNSYHFLVSFGYIAADGTPATLPFDKPYIEALKGVHFLFYNKQKLPILPVMLFSNYLPLKSYPDRSYYGGPTHECPYCGAVFWYQERVKSASAAATRKIVYNLCCRGGKINFKPYKKPPTSLADLLRFDGDARSKKFLRQIRSYNSLFAFTSLGATVDRTINNGTAPYVFKINRVVHHRIGTLLP